jgi:hypothetical protein
LAKTQEKQQRTFDMGNQVVNYMKEIKTASTYSNKKSNATLKFSFYPNNQHFLTLWHLEQNNRFFIVYLLVTF